MFFPLRHALALMAALATCAFAAEDLPRGLFHGAMAGYDGTPANGQLRVTNQAGDLFQCGYDARSYLEMQHKRITVANLREGDPLEVLADHPPGSTVCYVRTVHVTPPGPTPAQQRRAQALKDSARIPRKQDPLPRSMTTISGVVTAATEYSLTLRTRDGQETVALVGDTRYYGDGLARGWDALQVNMRVSVQAGRNRQGALNAYQVSWGSIVTGK